MTYKTKNYVFLFAFAAMMLAWPMLSTQTATAAEGQVTIPGVCGISVNGNVALGSLSPGAEGNESSLLTITTDGSIGGSFAIKAGDWVGVATTSTASIQLVSLEEGDTITVGGESFLAGNTQDGNNFVYSSDMSISATNLAIAINVNSVDDATATDTQNLVLLRSVSTGATIANAVTLSESEGADGSIVISGATFSGAEDAGVTHMESTVTRYSVTNTGTNPAASDYATKGTDNAFLGETEYKVIIIDTNPSEDITMFFQLTGVGTLINLPYSGALTQTLEFSTICA